MKKLCLLVLFLLFYHYGNENPLKNDSIPFKNPIIIKAQFYPAYTNLREWEGYYSNDVFDKGKETYAGISRVYHKNWMGWKHIDFVKNKKWNDKIELAEFWVLDFYLDVWVKNKYYLLNNQKMANYLFDFNNSGNKATYLIHYTLTDMGYPIASNEIDEKTINALNKVNPDVFLMKLKYFRIKWYESISNRDTTQRKWLPGWIRRAKSI